MAATLAVATALASATALGVGAFSVQAGTQRTAMAARASSRAEIGVSDNAPAIFADPRFRWLGVRFARLVVPWDVVSRRRELAWDAAWLHAAAGDGVRPLVAFDADPRHPRRLPSVTRYMRSVTAFMSMFPSVLDYSTWNEENHPLQPTASNPRRAAEYFNALSARCPQCSITAGDVLDISNMAPWLRAFLRYAHHPRLWGLHNYVDLWQGRQERTALMLRTVPGQVWFTETGGVVWRWERPYGGHSGMYVVHSEDQAALVASRLVALAGISRRITRVYYYQWRVGHTLQWVRAHGQVSWDSGLIRPDCSPRPAFAIIARALGRTTSRVPRARRNRAGNCV